MRPARSSCFDLKSLGKLLAEHRPDDALEAEHLRAMRQLLEGRENPLSRSSFEPGHFTASAFVLSPARDALLLIHHQKLQRWLQPGGHIEDEDADFISAARREVEEETHLGDLQLLEGGSPLLDVDVHRIPAHGNEAQHLHHDLRVAFVAGSQEIGAGDGVSEARWFALDEVRNVDSDASVMRALDRLRARIQA